MFKPERDDLAGFVASDAGDIVMLSLAGGRSFIDSARTTELDADAVETVAGWLMTWLMKRKSMMPGTVGEALAKLAREQAD